MWCSLRLFNVRFGADYFRACRAYQFWRANAGAFRTCFHMKGYSGHALRIAKWAFFFGGVRELVHRCVEAETVEEQARIWDQHIKPVFFTPWITRLFLANPSVSLLGLCPLSRLTLFSQDIPVECSGRPGACLECKWGILLY